MPHSEQTEEYGKGGAKGLGAGHATYSSHEKKCVYFIHKIF